MTALRTIVVLITWPLVHAADRLRGINPPARFSTGIRWARTGEPNNRP